MKQIKIDNLLKIDELNEWISDNNLVVNPKLKEALIKKSTKNKDLINFKLFNDQEYIKQNQFEVNPIIKFKLYKKYNNYYFANKIYKVLSQVSINIDYKKINTTNTKIIELINLLEEYQTAKLLNKPFILDNKNYLFINSFYFNEEQKIIIDHNTKQKIDIKKYNNIEEEISAISNNIAQLIDKGIDINDINIYAPNEYINITTLIMKSYNIPINDKNEYNILNNKIIENLINNLESNFLSITENENFLKLDSKLKNKIITLINQYVDVWEEDKFFEFLKLEISKINYKNHEFSNCINIKNIKDYNYQDNSYNYFIGFNNETFLPILKDNDYLNDQEKKIFQIQTTQKYNEILIDKFNNDLIYALNSQSNNYFSYSKTNGKQKYTINQYIKEEYFEYQIIANNYFNEQKRYSKINDLYFYKIKKELYQKYKYIDDDFINLEFNRKDFNKKEYDNQFTNNIKLNNINIKLSATSIEQYNKCQFRFFLKYILKLYVNSTNTLKMDIGNYSHYLLEKIVNNEYKKYGLLDSNNDIYEWDNYKIASDIQKYSDEYLKEKKDNKKHNDNFITVLIYRINKFFKLFIPVLFNQLEKEDIQKIEVEKQIEKKYKNHNFIGKIDFLFYDNNDNVYVLDYKSGNAELKIKKEETKEGINIQNLVYFFLLDTASNKFGGTFRQKINPKIVSNNKERDKMFLRNGYLNKSQDVQYRINNENYSTISKNNLWEEKDYEDKMDMLIQNIDYVIDDYQKGIYLINPINKDCCNYCEYKNICFKNKKNYRNIF